MKLEEIKKEIGKATANADKQRETKQNELTKLQERLAQVLIGIDDALLNDNDEKITTLTNEKREIEEKINLYNGFLKEFNKKPVISDEKAQTLFDELLKVVKASNHQKKYENIIELLKQLDNESNNLLDFIRDIEDTAQDLCVKSGHNANSRYGVGFEYKAILRGIFQDADRTLTRINTFK